MQKENKNCSNINTVCQNCKIENATTKKEIHEKKKNRKKNKRKGKKTLTQKQYNHKMNKV